MPLTDHPDRAALTRELHARPSPRVGAPGRVAYLALMPEGRRDRAAERAHLIALLDHFGAPHPPEGVTHYGTTLGPHRLKWESHTEFVTYMLLSDGLADPPFSGDSFATFPQDWLAQAPGRRITSALIRIEPAGEEPDMAARVDRWMHPSSLAMARVLDDDLVVAGDFQIDPAGHMRFAVFARQQVGAARIGRVVQRLCEIETYRAMSMLGLSMVRAMAPELTRIEAALTALTQTMGASGTRPQAALDQLLATAADLERIGAASSFRFGAVRAYEAIVGQRIAVLRETRFHGRQTFAEFMLRRYDPAMRTVKSTETRLRDLTDRALRAGNLLRTQVEVAHSAQNQALLESMDRRADLQLRLQQTVEGLSVVAISYYALNLVTYALAPLAKKMEIDKTTLTAAAVPVVVGLVWLSIRRIHRRMH